MLHLAVDVRSGLAHGGLAMDLLWYPRDVGEFIEQLRAAVAALSTQPS